MRNVRRDIKEAIDKLEKGKKISQDEQKRSLKEVEKVSHAETKKIEDLSAMKEKEVMEIPQASLTSFCTRVFRSPDLVRPTAPAVHSITKLRLSLK